MKTKFVYFLVILIYFCSCVNVDKSKNRLSNGDYVISIDLDRNDKVSVHDIFSEIEIIPLETNDKSLLKFPIGEPDRVIFAENKYYFLDKSQKIIIVFDAAGNFLAQINKFGHGPDEYLSLSDFNINSSNGNIEILSSEGRYIQIYDSEGKSLIDKVNFPDELPIISYFYILSSDLYILLSNAFDSKMFIYSKSKKKGYPIDYSLPQWINRKTSFSFSKNPFYSVENDVCFEQVHNGDVFTISAMDNKLLPRYLWDFGQGNFDINALPKDESMDYYLSLSKSISMKYAVLFQIYKENSKYYFTRFKYKNRYKHLVFDKEKNEYKLFDRFIEGGQCIPQWIDENAIYSFVPLSFLHHVLDLSLLNEVDRLKVSSISEFDNPIIIKFKFK